MTQSPVDRDAERTLLSAALLHVESARLVTRLGPGAFHDPRHGHVASAVCKVVVSWNGTTPSVVNVIEIADTLRSSGLLDETVVQVLHDLGALAVSPAMAPAAANVVERLAEHRRIVQLAADLSDAASASDDDRVARLLASITERPAATLATPVTDDLFVDWETFWDSDHTAADWLYPGVLARGRGHALYAGHKVGKSLLMLHVAAHLAINNKCVVVYLDYEMTEGDLYDRLSDMSHGDGADLSRLHYALLPDLPPLDTAAGGTALAHLLDHVHATHPGEHVAVIIDTTSRATSGKEDASDTIREFYRWSGIQMKRRGDTWGRLDHAGKDAARGQRGSSAKGDDVDVVWRLERTQDGVQLVRDAARMNWVPERTTLTIATDPLRYIATGSAWPVGTVECAQHLDDLAVDIDASERDAGRILRSAGHKASQTVLRSALRYRRDYPSLQRLF